MGQELLSTCASRTSYDFIPNGAVSTDTDYGHSVTIH